jgi:hypothetical protein
MAFALKKFFVFYDSAISRCPWLNGLPLLQIMFNLKHIIDRSVRIIAGIIQLAAKTTWSD